MRRKLFWKLGLSHLLLLLVALAVVYGFTARTVERHVLETTFSHLDALARMAGERPPDVSDASALREWTNWMATAGARVTVIDRDGVVLADSAEDSAVMENHAHRPEIRGAVINGRGRAIRFSATLDRDLVYLAVRHDWGPDPPVVLRVAEPLTSVSDAIAEVRGPVATISLVVLLVGGVISLLYSRAFSLRVRRLKEFSERVSEGDFRPAPVIRGGDEIEDLAESLNQTAARLASTIRSLEKARNQSDAILTSMSEGVAVVDASERVLYSNRAFREGLSLEEGSEKVEKRSLVELIRQAQILAMVRGVLATRERAESEVSLPGSPERHFLVRAAPVGESGAVVVLLDITDIRRLERVRRDFVANVSHELKTPLTAIQGFAETLLDGALADPDNAGRFAAIIREHAERLGRLTDDLLKLSRIEAGKLELEIRPVSLAEVVQRSVETVRIRAEQKSQAIEVELDDDELPRALADPDALTEVVQNLLANAVQYTAEGGHIRVHGGRDARDPDRVVVSVEDDGIGIPAKALGRLFERFYRVDAARSRKEGGTGLGLSIARHLMEAMNGSIDVESRLGTGSTFTLSLPCENERGFIDA